MSPPDGPRGAGGPHPALTELVTDVVGRAGLVLDDLDVRPAGRRRIVRVAVDTDEVPGPDDGPAPGVDLDAVAAVSRELSRSLDALDGDGEGARGADAVPADEYTLEVTTPGVDRPLTRTRHWRLAWLRRVAVTLADGTEVVGRVGPVTESDQHADRGSVTLALAPDPAAKGARRRVELRSIALGDVARAVLDVEFKPAPDAEVEALRAARGGTDTGGSPDDSAPTDSATADSTDTRTGKDQT